MSPKFVKQATLGMFLAALFLAFVSLSWQLSLDALSRLTSQPIAEELVDLMNVNEEANIPTWFSSSVLLLDSILLVVIYSAERTVGSRYATHWGALSVIFLLLSLDETAQVHDRTGKLLSPALHTGGFLTYAWVIPAAAFVFLFVLAYLRFFLALPTRRIKSLFFFSGLLYVGGALGMEMVVGYLMSVVQSAPGTAIQEFLTADNGVVFRLEETIEEFMEMSGAILFFYTLTQCGGASFSIRLHKRDYSRNETLSEDDPSKDRRIA
jgi:hypothetical protein